MLLPHICLHDPGRIYILLHSIVQHIILVKHSDKVGMCLLGNKDQHAPQYRDRDQHEEGNLQADRCCHDPGEHHHDGGPRQHADREHKGHLHVGDICRQPRHKTGRREMIYVSEREFLDLVKDVMPQVLGVPGGSNGSHLPGLGAEGQRQHSHDDKDDAHLYNVIHISFHDPNVDDIRHQERDQHLQQYLQRHQDRRQECLLLVLPHRFQ